MDRDELINNNNFDNLIFILNNLFFIIKKNVP